METPAQFGVYFAVLRKHLLLLGVSAALVVAAGVFYVARQQKVFSSSATLVIDTPTRNLAGGGGEYAGVLAAEEDELQTQVLLLKQNRGLAAKAVEKLRADGVDVAAGGYTERTLPASVKVEPIPGTRAWSFSLTGPDAESLPKAVNAYAQVFSEWSEGKSAKRSEQQEEALKGVVAEAEKGLSALQDEARKLDLANGALNLASGRNPATEELQALPKLATLDDERDADEAARAAIAGALAQAGVEVRSVDGANRLFARGDGPPIEERLFADERVAALPQVAANAPVAEEMREYRAAIERDRQLKEESYREDSPERQEAQRARREARASCGRKTANVLESALDAIDARRHRGEKLRKRIEELKAEEARVISLLIAWRDLETRTRSAERELGRASDALRAFQNRFLKETGTAAGESSRATRRILLETPAESAVQIAPKVPLIIGLTAFAAIAVGLGLVLLFEYLDDTIKSKEDFDRYVGLPFLGFIPRIESKDAERPDVAADAKTGSAIAEAFRAVRTSILFSRSGKPVRTILVTSAGPGEGKTTVAANLAITLAKHKAPVLLIDADLRRPRVAKALGVENKVGLTNYLVGDATLDEVIRPTSVEGLFTITSGPIPPNPAELLHGERLSELLTTGLLRFDRIVIDSPPVIAVSDARVIARCTDGLYLVISMGKTSWRLIQRSLESLTSIGFEVHGAILNNLAAPTGRYGYYYYRDYNYGKSYYVQPTQTQTPAPER